MATQIYNRRIKSPTYKPYVIFDGKNIPLTRLNIDQIVKVRGKPYSVYFRAKIKKGIPIE